MICQNCSNVIPDDSAFCGFCGQAVATSAAPVLSEPAPVAPEYSAPAPAMVTPEPPATPVAAMPVEPAPAPIPEPSAPVAETAPEPPAPEPVAEPEPVVESESAPAPTPMPVPAPDTATFFREEKQERRLGAWGYVWTDIVLALPLINIIMFFVWCFSSGTNKARQSYVRSRFIWFVISLILSIVVVILATAANPNFINDLNNSYAELYQNLY